MDLSKTKATPSWWVASALSLLMIAGYVTMPPRNAVPVNPAPEGQLWFATLVVVAAEEAGSRDRGEAAAELWGAATTEAACHKIADEWAADLQAKGQGTIVTGYTCILMDESVAAAQGMEIIQGSRGVEA